MNIFASIRLNDDERRRLLALSPDDAFFVHDEFPDEEPPHPEFLQSQICFGNVPPAWLPQHPQLAWMQLTSTGLGEYLSVAREHACAQLQMTNLAGFFAQPVAESMLAGVLALYRGIGHLAVLKESRTWVGGALREHLQTLQHATVLLYGHGAIGRRFAELIAPFSCRVITCTSRTTPAELERGLGIADVVACTAPDTPATRGVFDRARLSMLGKRAIFVNFGRGSVVDETALAELLENRAIGGAVIDVTMQEPISPQHRLWRCPNTLITQHSGGGTEDETEKVIGFFAANLERFRRGEALHGVADLNKGY